MNLYNTLRPVLPCIHNPLMSRDVGVTMVSMHTFRHEYGYLWIIQNYWKGYGRPSARHLLFTNKFI